MKKNIVNEVIADANKLLSSEAITEKFLIELKSKNKKELIELCNKYLIGVIGISYHYTNRNVDTTGEDRYEDMDQALKVFAELYLKIERIPTEKEWLSEIGDTKYKWAFKRKNQKELDALPNGLGYSRARGWYRKFNKILKVKKIAST